MDKAELCDASTAFQGSRGASLPAPDLNLQTAGSGSLCGRYSSTDDPVKRRLSGSPEGGARRRTRVTALRVYALSGERQRRSRANQETVSELALTPRPGSAEGNFNKLYERLQPSLWRYVHRLIGDRDAADDVVQEAFVRLLSRPDLDADAARLWVFTVATNLVRDRGRTVARRQKLLKAVQVAPQPLRPPDDRVEREEQVRRVRAALDRLTERDRQLLLMREEGFRYQEIAEAVGVAPGSVGTLIARAVKRFTGIYGSSAE